MRLLFLSQYYPPEIGAASNRIGYFARYLAKAGHNVTVLTSAPNYPEGKLYPGYQNRFTKKEENGVTVVRTRILLTPKKNMLTRLAHYLSFIVASFIARPKIQKPDMIIATSPPIFTGLLGVIFKKLWKAPLVLDVRDLWPQSVESVGAVRNRGLLAQTQRLANWMYKNATHITATSKGIQKHLPKSVQQKISIMPNGAELDLFQHGESGARITKMFSLHGKFVALYTGNLGLAQATEVLVEAAELLKARHDIMLLIVGSGVLLPELEQQARAKNLSNIIFTGARPRDEMPEYIAASDVCIIPYKVSDTFRNTLPSKMFDYMAGGKPVVINLNGEASELIAEADCGMTIEENSAKALAESILYLKNQPAKAGKFGNNGRKFVEKKYTREAVAADLQRLLETQFS